VFDAEKVANIEEKHFDDSAQNCPIAALPGDRFERLEDSERGTGKSAREPWRGGEGRGDSVRAMESTPPRNSADVTHAAAIGRSVRNLRASAMFSFVESRWKDPGGRKGRREV
jgi:hypothetical protein